MYNFIREFELSITAYKWGGGGGGGGASYRRKDQIHFNTS